jgi:hypothetical protein
MWEIWWLKVQKVILPNLVFQVSIQQSVPQLRKNQNMKPLVGTYFSGTCLQSKNFVEIVCRFCQQSGQLWKQITRDLFGFPSACIYSLERVFGQLSNDAFFYFRQIQSYTIRG